MQESTEFKNKKEKKMHSSKNFLEDVQRKMDKAFKAQNPDMFDVAFDFDGQKLYAHKFRLSLISTTFEAMLSDRWISKNKTIPIKNYNYENFKEFLTFIYSGVCELNDDNVLVMLDLAEFYQIHHLKELTEEYLTKMELNNGNIFQVMELADKYFLTCMKKLIHDFISENFSSFVKSDEFMNFDNSFVKEIIKIKPKSAKQHEEMFESIYKWAENQANQQLHDRDIETFIVNNAIKTKITEFLPHSEFEKMGLRFLKEYVVTRGFVFTSDQLSEILEYLQLFVSVKVTNSNGQSIYGKISRENIDAIEAIKSVKNHESRNCSTYIIYWKSKCKIPETPSALKKQDDVKLYLTCFPCGEIHVTDNANHGSILLAEMCSSTDFEFTTKCKIDLENF